MNTNMNNQAALFLFIKMINQEQKSWQVSQIHHWRHHAPELELIMIDEGTETERS